MDVNSLWQTGWHGIVTLGSVTYYLAAVEGVPPLGSAGALARLYAVDAGGVNCTPIVAEVQVEGRDAGVAARAPVAANLEVGALGTDAGT